MPCSTVQCSAVQCSAVQCSAVWLQLLNRGDNGVAIRAVEHVTGAIIVTLIIIMAVLQILDIISISGFTWYLFKLGLSPRVSAIFCHIEQSK